MCRNQTRERARLLEEFKFFPSVLAHKSNCLRHVETRKAPRARELKRLIDAHLTFQVRQHMRPCARIAVERL